MKVLVLASLAYSLTNFRRALLAAMADAGHEVIACAPEDDAEVRSALAANGIRYAQVAMERTGINPFADLRTIAGYLRLLRTERPDVVLAYTQKPIIYGGIATRIAGGVRFYAMVSGLGYAFTGVETARRRLFRAAVSRLYRAGVARAARIFVFNRDDGAEMRTHGIVRPEQDVVQVPGSGIDTRRFAHQPVPEGPPIFLLIARLLRDKGLAEYAEAARRVKATHPQARFQLLGPMDPNPAAISKAELDGWIAEGAIEYLGETKDVVPYLAACGVYVLPSYREGLPRTVLEAMATGRAVITTDAPGCREPVTEGENGLLVPVGNADALAGAMRRFVEDPALMVRMGARSRERAVSHYDVNKVNALLLDAMELDRPVAALPAGRSRRIFEMAVAGLGGIIAMPLFALIALTVAVTMGRPVLFTQLRSGWNSRPFRLIKFRSMTDARDGSGRLLPDEARTTAFGRFLRRSRIDELPELWNILKGEMGLIGPRPLLPETVETMGAPGIERGLLRPGLTGWAQVNGNAQLSEAEKLSLDLWYIRNRSLRLDLLIIWKTIGVIFRGERINRSEIGRAYAGGHRRRG